MATAENGEEDWSGLSSHSFSHVRVFGNLIGGKMSNVQTLGKRQQQRPLLGTQYPPTPLPRHRAQML